MSCPSWRSGTSGARRASLTQVDSGDPLGPRGKTHAASDLDMIAEPKRFPGWNRCQTARRGTQYPLVQSQIIVVASELSKLPLEVERVPEEDVIEILTPHRADEPLDEGV